MRLREHKGGAPGCFRRTAVRGKQCLSIALLNAALIFAVGCSSDSDGSGGSGNGEEMSGGGVGDQPIDSGSSTDSEFMALAAGNIDRYGVVNVVDDSGLAADVIASFFELNEGVAASAIAELFTGDQPRCSVSSGGAPSVFDISAAYLPELAATVSPMDIGESIVLNSANGQYASLEKTDVGQFLFYTLPIGETLPAGAVPDSIQVAIDADAGNFTGMYGFGTVEVLSDFNWPSNNTGGQSTIATDTQFRWTPGENPGQWLRFVSQTAGGYFLDESVSVTCLVPDTGSFSFPASVQGQLGEGFSGSPPMVSRLSVLTVSNEDAALILVRESFVN